MNARTYQPALCASGQRCVGLAAATVVLFTASATPGQTGLTITPPTPLNNNASADSGDDSGVRVVVGDAGVWLAVWRSTDDLGGTIGSDADILTARSVDSGATWSDPTPVDPSAGLDDREDSSPVVVTGDQGVWVVAWTADELPDTRYRGKRILVTRSTDDGRTWENPTLLSADVDPNDTYNSDVRLETDGRGNWVAVWESWDDLGGTVGSDGDILTAGSSDNGATWSNPTPLNTNADSDAGGDRLPQVATDGAGAWVAVWESRDALGGTVGTDLDILTARSFDNGLTWSDPAPLNSDAMTDASYIFPGPYANDLGPRVTTDGNGTWVVAWTLVYCDLYCNDWIRVATSTDAGATWTDPSWPCGVPGGPTGTPEPATDGSGSWLLVWTADSWDPEAQESWHRSVIAWPSSNGGVTWERPTILHLNLDNEEAYVIGAAHTATDRQGNWATVWSAKRELIRTLGDDWDVLFVVSGDNGATWTVPAPLDANATMDSGDDVSPQLITDQRGNWLVVWKSDDDLDGTIGDDYDILTARFAIPDCNGNITPDQDDFASGASADCNGNGVPDECDIRSGLSVDCNENGVPDSCELASGASSDANANNIPDDCEPDCNENARPDELDISDGSSADCNANGVPDECDISSGVSADCNENGVPDACDLASGVSADANADGVPDECEPAPFDPCSACGLGAVTLLLVAILASRSCRARRPPRLNDHSR